MLQDLKDRYEAIGGISPLAKITAGADEAARKAFKRAAG